MDVNYYLGSWGPQPEDRPVAPDVTPDLLTADDWLEMAQRWADLALEAIEDGMEEAAAWRARWIYRYCRNHRLLVGGLRLYEQAMARPRRAAIRDKRRGR